MEVRKEKKVCRLSSLLNKEHIRFFSKKQSKKVHKSIWLDILKTRECFKVVVNWGKMEKGRTLQN